MSRSIGKHRVSSFQVNPDVAISAKAKVRIFTLSPSTPTGKRLEALNTSHRACDNHIPVDSPCQDLSENTEFPHSKSTQMCHLLNDVLHPYLLSYSHDYYFSSCERSLLFFSLLNRFIVLIHASIHWIHSSFSIFQLFIVSISCC